MSVVVTVETRLPADGTTSEVGEGPEAEVRFSPGFATPCSVLAVISLSIHCNCSGVNGGNSAALSPSSAITLEKLLCAPPELLIARRLHCTETPMRTTGTAYRASPSLHRNSYAHHRNCLLRVAFTAHCCASSSTRQLKRPHYFRRPPPLSCTARIAAPPRPSAIEPALPRGPQPPGR